MKSTLKMFAIIFAVLIGLVVLGFIKDSIPKIEKAAKEPNIVDDFIGKTAIDRYTEIKGEADTFNLPALRTEIMMFYTQKGRYPKSMEELDQSEESTSSATRDKHGKLLDLKIIQNKAFVTSPGSDRIFGTTDDITREISL